MTNDDSRVICSYCRYVSCKMLRNPKSWSDLKIPVTVKYSITPNTLTFVIFKNHLSYKTDIFCITEVWRYWSPQGGGLISSAWPTQWFRTWSRVPLGPSGAVTISGSNLRSARRTPMRAWERRCYRTRPLDTTPSESLSLKAKTCLIMEVKIYLPFVLHNIRKGKWKKIWAVIMVREKSHFDVEIMRYRW